jgi:hypothetical protein
MAERHDSSRKDCNTRSAVAVILLGYRFVIFLITLYST